MVKAKRTEKEGELERLYRTTIAAKKALREFEDENDEILSEHKDLLDTIEGLRERIKIEARKLAESGKNKVLIDNADIHVSVQGKQSRRIDFKKASDKWPTWVVEAATVSTIDAKVVDSLVSAGKVRKETIDSAVVVEDLTPAVTITLP